jgi:hypothetical protein
MPFRRLIACGICCANCSVRNSAGVRRSMRLTNEDVIDLYSRVKVGALVVVLGPKQGLSRVASAGSSYAN